MASVVPLRPDDDLPLTCQRGGHCCHGHDIPLTPWEIALMARTRQLDARSFRDRFTVDGGTRLRFDGATDRAGRPSCSQLAPGDDEHTCAVYAVRPLACRLYPLQRDRWDGRPRYIHASGGIDCYRNCPTVIDQPHRTVADFLAGNAVRTAEEAHDAYHAMAFGLVRRALQLCDVTDSGVTRDGLAAIIRHAGTLTPEGRARRLPAHWLDLCTAPALDVSVDDPAAFIAAHARAISAALDYDDQCSDPGCSATLLVLMGLHLGNATGSDYEAMAELVLRPAM